MKLWTISITYELWQATEEDWAALIESVIEMKVK
jgi:hypothetical protein